MEETPIVSTLFSFVTTRSPQLLTDKEIERGFIYFPPPQKGSSHYLNNLDNEPDADSRRTFLETQSAAFTAFTSRAEIKALHSDLYEYSLWLMKQKNILTIDMSANMTKPSGLTNTELVRLWDEVFYQTLTQSSDAIRECVLRLIIAHNFIGKDDSAQTGTGRLITTDAEIQRLASAYVVIGNNVISNHKELTYEESAQDPRKTEVLENRLKQYDARQRITKLKTVKKELADVTEVARNENISLYRTAYETYRTAERTAYENATVTTDPDTGEKIYSNFVRPALNYTPKSVANTSYITGKVSSVALETLESYIDDGITEETSLTEKVNEDLSKAQRDFDDSSMTSKQAVYNGTALRLVSEPNIGELILYTKITNDLPTEYEFTFALATGMVEPSMTSNTLKIVTDGSPDITDIPVKLTQSDDGVIFVTFESTTVRNFGSSPKLVTLEGAITINDSEDFTVDAEIDLDVARSVSLTSNTLTSAEIVQPIELHGIEKMGVMDFRRVEQEVCCYVPGEVSRIENILAKEYKERSTRQLLSTENTTEDITDTEIEKLTDTTTSERSELASEISAIMSEESSENYGASASVSGSYGAISFGVNAFYNGASASSSSNSNNQSQFQAEEVTQRALERVVQKTTKRRTSRILREFEENNKHGFDNREGTSHVTGVYRWVDKIYTNRLVNYGKRLVYQFNVPEPSRFFKEAIIQFIEGKTNPSISTVPDGLLVLPEPPEINFNASQLSESNYQRVAARYGASVSAPPKPTLYIGHSFSYSSPSEDGFGNKHERYGENAEVSVPEGYKTVGANSDWSESVDDGNAGGLIKHMNISVGGANVTEMSETEVPLLGHLETVPVSFSSHSHKSGNVTIRIRCILTDEGFQNWQNATFAAIQSAYQDRFAEYNDYLYQTFEPTIPDVEGESRRMEFNPLFNRALEKRELKRLAIDMIARPFGIQTARKAYGGSDAYPFLNNSLDEHAKYVTFFEQCFEWEIMAYSFYPYFYSEYARWKDLFAESNGTDPVFQAFLQSAMARMVVPVRQGFEKAVTYFLETGKIMVGDSLAVDRGDDLYLSIAEELEKPAEGVVEKEWETRVPTDLTIVQANSAPLDANGLPCCHNEDATDNLGHGTSIMSGQNDATA